MTFSIELKNTTSEDRLDEMYAEDYYWYLKCPQFVSCFLRPLGDIIAELGGPCLDIGCGEGWLSDYVENIEYHGIDLSREAIDYARTRRPQRSFEIARFETYPEQTERQFRTVVFGNILWYYVKPNDYVRLLRHYQACFGCRYLVVYDLYPLDTTDIDKHFKLIHSFDAKADVTDLQQIKLRRKVRVYECT